MYVGQWPTFHGPGFCLISWRLLDGLMLYWRYLFSVTQTLNRKYICRSVTYISWSNDFALYLEDYLMDKRHNWNTRSMWCKDLPDKMFVGQWPTFHGPVILYYILKTTWWINDVLEILILTQILNWNYIICRPVTYISWYNDFALYLEDCLMDKCHNWNIGSMWCKD